MTEFGSNRSLDVTQILRWNCEYSEYTKKLKGKGSQNSFQKKNIVGLFSSLDSILSICKIWII